jgi:hypothetical protein
MENQQARLQLEEKNRKERRNERKNKLSYNLDHTATEILTLLRERERNKLSKIKMLLIRHDKKLPIEKVKLKNRQ